MEFYDLLLVVDATASMKNYLESLNISLPQIISISAVTGCFSRIGLLVYRDYVDWDGCLQFSGWLDVIATDSQTQPDLVAFARNLNAKGGGDYPEAAKTALAKAHELMRSDANTLILLYTDAPPHTIVPRPGMFTNADIEHRALSREESFGGMGPCFRDWVSAAKTLRDGPKRSQVFALLEPEMLPKCATFYNFLCEMTHGACIHVRNSQPDTISKAAVELLLAWMGVEKEMVEDMNNTLPGDLSRYMSVDGMVRLEGEGDSDTRRFFPVPYTRDTPVLNNITKVTLTSDVVKEHLPKKSTPAMNPIARWKSDFAYREMAARHLMRIIKEDLRAISINPVFGALWRAVCEDRTYTGRDGLVDAFSRAVGEVKDPEKKEEMQHWLDESYNFSAEIQSIIDDVPAANQFPCVFLDPTLDFSDALPTQNKSPRAELLEIARSCDPLILQRLGRILTGLTYVKEAREIPEHIAKSTSKQVRKIPLTLATDDYNRQFWKVLLHTIVPGSRLPARGAAVLAALTIRLGITFLANVAESEMINYKDKWNNIEVPETWSISCMTLLLEANSVYQKMQEPSQPGKKSLLLEKDTRLFERLVAFKSLEHNLDTPLTVQLPWTPNKATYRIGPLVTCKVCNYPRSVTVMGQRGKCGICLAADPANPEKYATRVKLRVSRDTTAESHAVWVECKIPCCRAQYVVYSVETLNVQAKCHYCRQQSITGGSGQITVAPVVEYTKCRSRIIFPDEYRPADFDVSLFTCPACESGRETTIQLETTARVLAVENTMAWLAKDNDRASASPFTNRSAFHTISTMGPSEFMRRITLFPQFDEPLTVRGKPILNTEAIKSILKEYLAGRKSAKAQCSLCFLSFWPSALTAACGRRGCLQRICTGCSAAWYGSNAPGTVINAAALTCPFCRRLPAPQKLASYGNGVHAVRDLNRVVSDRGAWIYAWCSECATAREYVERDCARGTPPALRDWTCENCEDEVLRAAEELRRETREQLQRSREQKEADRVSRMRPCPKCETLTEKTSGCGHITCPVQGCGIDWCYFCGEQFSGELIYAHMTDAHGGIYDDDVYDSEDIDN
ncbi:hypothetical protein BJX61DRAFT_505484 [Aspergillus egyptiacus]|nr:hypothetical protein BJX61DRAFT_505484 [Aspergillus egyptiacus]